MKEAVGTRLTTAIGGVDGGTMGSAAGRQSQTLALSQNSTGLNDRSNASQAISVSGLALNQTTDFGSLSPGTGNPFFAWQSSKSAVTVTSTGNNAISVTSNNTGGLAHPNVQPTIVCNYIIRII